MFILIIGLGEVGQHLVSVLSEEGHDLVAIDADDAAAERIREIYDVSTITGYGANADILAKAEAGEADLVLAVTDNDEVNLVAAISAKALGAKRTIARAQGPVWTKWNHGVRYGALGIDAVVNPRILLAQELAMIAHSRGATEITQLAQDRITIENLTLPKDSDHAGLKLMELDLPPDMLVGAIGRRGRLFVPHGASILKSGDNVYLIGEARAVRRAEAYFLRAEVAHAVCIVGGGEIGETLARTLKDTDVDTLIIEKDRARAEAVSAALDGVTVIHGDGTDLALLEEEEVHRYDMLVGATSDDEQNLMVALLGKQLKVRRTACVVGRASYVPVYKKLGIDAVRSPRISAARQVLRYARAEKVQSISVLGGGAAEVVELQAHGDSKAVGRTLRELNMPKGSLVAAIVRGQDVTIGSGDVVIRAGDTVILLWSPETRPIIEKIFHSNSA